MINRASISQAKFQSIIDRPGVGQLSKKRRPWAENMSVENKLFVRNLPVSGEFSNRIQGVGWPLLHTQLWQKLRPVDPGLRQTRQSRPPAWLEQGYFLPNP